MTHRQPKFSQILVCEIGEDAKIDIVLDKALRIVGHAELFEPVRNLLHRVAALRRTSRGYER
jgi:hypothetical protein